MGSCDLATTLTGTPHYMSPEALKHQGYNTKSDIWWVGGGLVWVTHLSAALREHYILVLGSFTYYIHSLYIFEIWVILRPE